MPDFAFATCAPGLEPALKLEVAHTRPELRQLDLRGNPLAALPGSIAALPRLDKLDLRWNPYRELPETAAALRERGCFVLWP